MSKIGYIRHLSKSESIDLQLLKLRSYGSNCIFIESKTRRNCFTVQNQPIFSIQF